MQRSPIVHYAAIAAGLTVSVINASPLNAQAVRDSAGIQIVENAKALWTPAQALHLSKTPTLIIGTQEGEPYELSRVTGAVQLGDRRIVVGDEGSLQLRYFDANGKFAKRVGGKGDGPGEFRTMERLTILPGDTLVALHANGYRIVSLFTADGSFIKRFDIAMSKSPPVAGKPVNGSRSIVATLGGGLRVMREYSNPEPRTGGARWIHTAPITIFDKDNKPVKSLGDLPISQYEMMETPQYTWLGPTGQFASYGNTFYFGFGDKYSVNVYNADGRLIRIVRRSWKDIPITKADVNAFTVEWSKRWANKPGPEGDKERADIRDDPYATKVPAFSQLIADRVGRLWVRETHLADAARAGSLSGAPLVPSVWSVFDSNGKWQGDVTMPASFPPTDIGTNYVLGVARDADNVQTVVMYSLTAGAAK